LRRRTGYVSALPAGMYVSASPIRRTTRPRRDSASAQ